MAPLSDLPNSTGATVDVSIIHGGTITLATEFLVANPLPGHKTITAPCYSFLVENKARDKKLLFDLGLPKAWTEKFPPVILNQLETLSGALEIETDVAEHLLNNNVPLESINAIIWSHNHLDHIGDPSTFPPSTDLIVGPGFKTNKDTWPGYPVNSDAKVSDDAFHGREVIELDFDKSASGVQIGGFPAIDWFGDGSFYILKTTGHTHDHISGLARTTDNKFIFMGGDIAHHAGEFRPSPHLPLPDEIHPSPLDKDHASPLLPALSACPGSIIEKIHARSAKTGTDYRTTPFYVPNHIPNASPADADAAIEKLQVFDAAAEVFVVIAHDRDLESVLPFFPERISDWHLREYKEVGAWRFLRDFLNVEA